MDLSWASLPPASDPALAEWLEGASCGPHVKALTELCRTGAPDEVHAAIEAEFSAEEIAALTFAIVAINGWNRLAVGLPSDVLSLDGLDLPAGAPAPAGQ